MINMRRSPLDQFGAVTDKRAKRTNFSVRSKRGRQQAKRMELLQPLRIIPIGFSARDGLDVALMKKIGGYAGRLQQFVDWDLKHASLLHHDSIDATFEQPSDERV